MNIHQRDAYIATRIIIIIISSKQMEEKPEYMAMLDTVRASMAKLFHMATEVHKTTTHDISSEADYNGQEMEDVSDDGYDDCADGVDLGSMVDKLTDECRIDRDEAVKRLGAFYKGKRSGCVCMGNRTLETQKRMGSAVLTQCRLFDLEGAMTDPTQIRDKILTMETITLRHDPLAVPHVHESTVAAMSVIGSPTGNVCV